MRGVIRRVEQLSTSSVDESINDALLSWRFHYSSDRNEPYADERFAASLGKKIYSELPPESQAPEVARTIVDGTRILAMNWGVNEQYMEAFNDSLLELTASGIGQEVMAGLASDFVYERRLQHQFAEKLIGLAGLAIASAEYAAN